ncbi:RNA polymerase factor sigma-54 [Pleionea mediterranea]|uniref:RNA polymerase sigma-54 factor n=1 Tax=Pleionea mediterranea TaxID=523701 RepID=A0A316FFV9_9GAMM|nr:RNA polymerase factor sigma-54 [Pleionea mediterranea]PWK47798.1 RNA polymerase RpoN-/SigL-like sigma 54 subunit [Pleionea mediterranea]
MKPSLQLKIGQSLTMTPQLQQAIRLLQLSSLDLQNEIQEALESNPMLEGNEDLPQESKESDSNGKDTESSASEKEASEIDTSDALKNETIDKDLAVDTQWEDWQYSPPSSMARSDDDREFEYQGETSLSLHDHLAWQLDFTQISERDKTIALVLIDEIDDEGYLRTPISDIEVMLNEDEQEEFDEQVETDEIEAVLSLIQSFDPVGVGAQNLQECLQLQLNQFSEEVPFWIEAKELIDDHFDALAARNYKQIIRQTKWPEDFLKEVVTFVQRLNPRPGSNVSSSHSEYVVPDVFVSKKNGRWTVELNPDCAPKLKINTGYASLIKRADSSADNTFLKNNLQEAKWFIKSLQSRNETLLKVATSIVEKQMGFFEYGEEAMKPLVLSMIAEEVEMHESTVSRVTTQKYMHTPRGIFELKYFFSSHVSTAAGGECSSTAIRALIKKLIAAENNAKPLSDNKIANLLKEQGINVARRTIAKYREAMNIPPSNERKSLI